MRTERCLGGSVSVATGHVDETYRCRSTIVSGACLHCTRCRSSIVTGACLHCFRCMSPLYQVQDVHCFRCMSPLFQVHVVHCTRCRSSIVSGACLHCTRCRSSIAPARNTTGVLHEQRHRWHFYYSMMQQARVGWGEGAASNNSAIDQGATRQARGNTTAFPSLNEALCMV
jgi:hypothetical protein